MATGVGITSAQVRGAESTTQCEIGTRPRSPARSTPFPRSRPGRPVRGQDRVPVGQLLGSDAVTTAEPATAPDGLRPVDVLTVVAVTDVTPSVRRVVLSGTPAAVAAAGPTVYLLVPRVGDAAPRWPRVAKDGRIVWPQGSHGVALRSYTARRQDPAAGEVEIDFVLHGDGPAAAWAAAAAPGRAARRRRRRRRSASGRPATCCWPATRRRCPRSAGSSARPRRHARSGRRWSRWPAPRRSSRWPRRPGSPCAGCTAADVGPGESTLLADAVAALDRPEGDDVFAWVGAESAAVRAHPGRPARPLGPRPGPAPRDRLLAAGPGHVARRLRWLARGGHQAVHR